jgi:DNA-binding MarR family transcriptional regulator
MYHATIAVDRRALESAATHEPGVRDVASRLAVDASTASRLVDQSVRAGYVERSASDEDRRRCVLALTADGRALLERATNVRAAFLAEWVCEWSPADVTVMAQLVDRLADAVFSTDPAAAAAGPALVTSEGP